MGFLLLELKLVLALLSVQVWVALPRYGEQQVQGRNAAMQLEAIANTSCNISFSTRNDFTITVMGDQGRFELRAEPATGAHSDTLTLDHLGRQTWFDDE